MEGLTEAVKPKKTRMAVSPIRKSKQSAIMKKKWADPVYRAKMMHTLGSMFARRQTSAQTRGKRRSGAGGYSEGLTLGIMCRFEPKVFARIERYAQERHISFAESVRRLVLYGLGR